MRVNILESKKGRCLYEKVWKWSGISRNKIFIYYSFLKKDFLVQVEFVI